MSGNESERLNEVTVTRSRFAIFTFAFHAAIRFTGKLLDLLAGMFYAAIRISLRILCVLLAYFGVALMGIGGLNLFWQVRELVRTGQVPGSTVADAFAWLNVAPPFISIQGWVGLSKILNTSLLWFLELPLFATSFVLGAVILASVSFFNLMPDE